MPEVVDPQPSGGLTRREFLKRGAITGGILWSAPVSQTIAAPSAFAESIPQNTICAQAGGTVPSISALSFTSPLLSATVAGGNAPFLFRAVTNRGTLSPSGFNSTCS